MLGVEDAIWAKNRVINQPLQRVTLAEGPTRLNEG